MNNTTNLSSLIWSSADDVLRGMFKPSEYWRMTIAVTLLLKQTRYLVSNAGYARFPTIQEPDEIKSDV